MTAAQFSGSIAIRFSPRFPLKFANSELNPYSARCIASMSKGKYKRKRGQAKKRTQHKANQARLLDSEVVPPENQPKTPDTTNQDRDHEEEEPVGFREFLKRPTVTDWCVMAFTGVLASVATSIKNGERKSTRCLILMRCSRS